MVPIEKLPSSSDTLQVFLAGVKESDNQLWSKGGRVLSLCALSKDLASARELIYKNLGQVMFKDMSFRNDIGVLKCL